MSSLVRVALCLGLVAGLGACGSRGDTSPRRSSRSVPAKRLVEPAPPTAPAAPRGDRWAELLAFDTGGRDLSVQSYSLPDADPLVHWSSMSLRICDEDDPVGTAIALGAAATVTRDAERTRRGLRCGRFVAEHLPRSARVHVLELDRADRSMPLLVVPTTLRDVEALEPLVVDHHLERRGGRGVLCRPFDRDGRTCADGRNERDQGVAVVGGYLVAGSFSVLSRFLDWASSARVLGLLDDITTRFGDTEVVEVDFLDPDGRWTIGPRRWLPFTTVGISDDLATTVRLRARAVGWDLGMTAGSIMIAPRCEDDACAARDALVSALGGYHGAWKQTARQRMESLMPAADGVDAASDCLRRAETARVDAITASAVTTRDGAVTVSYRANDASPATCLRAEDEASSRAAVQRVRAALGEI